jgi:Ca2+-binding RTX toxin-like protein
VASTVTGSNRKGAAAGSLALAALLLWLLLPEPAGATIYCVAEPSCPQGGLAEATLEEAIEAADLNAAPDTVRIGPGEFTSGSLGANTTVDIVGAGRDATRIVADQAVMFDLLSIYTSGSSVSNLELRVTKSNTNALRLNDGADVSDLSIRAASSLTGIAGIHVEEAGTEATRLDIRLGPDGGNQAILAGDQGIFTDSFVQAGIGIAAAGGPTIARRLHIRAGIGLYPFGGILTIRDSVVEPDPESAFFTGADVNSSNGAPETAGGLVAVNVTIVGNGQPGSVGVVGDGNTGDVAVNLRNSIVANVQTSLLRAEQVGEDVDLTVRNSTYDGSKTLLAGAGSGSDILQNNFANAPDSGFVNAGASDYRLRPDSVLVDAGNPVPPTSETDFRGLPRVRDGNADGSSVVDIGAFEYQRLPPSPAFSFTPAVPLFGDPVSFDGAASSDVDGDPMSLSWSLGDGAGATGAQTSRLYALPGTYQAALTATDITGLSASVTHPVNVGLRAGRCANRRKGTARADRVKGFPAGDRLDGLGGNDVLSGGAGDDCLFGRAGKDRLKGGAGSDRLKGGGGNDVLDVRGGGRDRAHCGGGRDRVLADERDRLRRCEQIRTRASG